MSNVQITKQCENETTDKLNVNPPLLRKEVSLIFRWLKVVHSLPPPDEFEPSQNQATFDVHFNVTKAELNTYADDNQLHFSNEC